LLQITNQVLDVFIVIVLVLAVLNVLAFHFRPLFNFLDPFLVCLIRDRLLLQLRLQLLLTFLFLSQD